MFITASGLVTRVMLCGGAGGDDVHYDEWAGHRVIPIEGGEDVHYTSLLIISVTLSGRGDDVH